MRALISQNLRNLPIPLSAALWLAAFVSPTVYVLLLVIANKLQVPAPPASFVVTLFCLIPFMALLVCGAAAWQSNLHLHWRIGWVIMTVLAMLLQCGVLLVIIISAVTVAISPAQ